MSELLEKLTALVEEANAAGAFASIGSVPVEVGTKKEIYFTLVVPAEPTTTE
jgi:hypothetical protein